MFTTLGWVLLYSILSVWTIVMMVAISMLIIVYARASSSRNRSSPGSDVDRTATRNA